MESQLAALFTDYSARKLKQLGGRIETCLEKLTDDQVWARGSDNENAIGNLVLHLCGNVRQWILTGVGGKPDVRNRDREFSARGDIPKSDLAERLKAAVEDAEVVIRGVGTEKLASSTSVQNYKDITVLEVIEHVVEHFSYHTGQIVFATKMLTQEDMAFYRHLSNSSHQETTP